MDAQVLPPKEFKTQSEAVFNRLRGDIINGRLLPGAKLTSDILRQQYSVGISPLREALSRLSGFGLVTQEGQRGFRVAGISVEELLDLTKVRIWVECAALRSSFVKGGNDWEGEVLAAAHRLTGERFTNPQGHVDERWEERHRAFHNSLVQACGSPHLLRYREILYDLSDRYRRLATLIASKERDVQGEHDGIAKAVMARDPELACALLENHLLSTTELILRVNLRVENSAELVTKAKQDLRIPGKQFL
jgi:GntR family carbon starvation induced transcriptional regulator